MEVVVVGKVVVVAEETAASVEVVALISSFLVCSPF